MTYFRLFRLIISADFREICRDFDFQALMAAT